MRVGLFLRNLDEEFQITVFRGIRDRARERGVDLLCVQGETVRDRGEGGERPFALAGPVRFDGILVLSPVIIDNSDVMAVSGLGAMLPPLPCVSVGLRVPGMTSLEIKNRRSMARIMEHLVLDHGYRRFLFLGGPRHHKDSRTRERVFRQSLKAFEPSLPGLEWEVDYGGFSEATAAETMRRHFSDRPYDAIVAANDNMALGVLKELRLRGDPAWTGCAVTGFDDIPQAALELPPLTSVHQPLEELGASSLDRLVGIIAGERVPSFSSIESWPVIRESCGCSALATAVPSALVPADLIALAERLSLARLRALESERLMRRSGAFGRDLSSVTELGQLLSFLDDFLSDLGVPDFHLLAFGKRAVGEAPSGGLLVYERRSGLRSSLPERGLELGFEEFFSSRPGRSPADGCWSLCLSHLKSGREQLGVVLYSADDGAPLHLASAMPHLANALKRLRVFASQEDRNRRLELMVEARTRDLTLANERLTEEIERRRATEGEVLQVSEFERRRFGLDLHDDICQRLAGIGMYIKGYRGKMPDDSAELFAEIGGLVDETLLLTRQYAHASFPMDLERRGLDAVLGSLCESVAAQNGCACAYSSELPALDPPLDAQDSLNVYRIVQEALHNAAKHARATRIDVAIRLSPGACELHVRDDGRGMDAAGRPAEGGLGLRSMAYRASQLGASFSIKSAAGKGTSVRLEIPLRR